MQDVDLPASKPVPDVPDGTPVAPPTVDVVLPVFNEEVVLERSVERLHAYLSEHFPFT